MCQKINYPVWCLVISPPKKSQPSIFSTHVFFSDLGGMVATTRPLGPLPITPWFAICPASTVDGQLTTEASIICNIHPQDVKSSFLDAQMSVFFCSFFFFSCRVFFIILRHQKRGGRYKCKDYYCSTIINHM